MSTLIRKIEKRDNEDVKELIQTVMTEFGAVGEGYSIVDDEVKDMYTSYNNPASCFHVVELNEKVLGGGGIAPLKGGDSKTCEIKKMYFTPELRGKGLGSKLLEILTEEAKNLGYEYCYLETLINMESAIKLYKKHGFIQQDKPHGSTGHYKCNQWFLKKL